MESGRVKACRPTGTVPCVGARVEVYWEQDDMWYAATVEKAVDVADFTNELHYDDGDVEMLDMRLETWRLFQNPVVPKNLEQVSSSDAAASARCFEKQGHHPSKMYPATMGGSVAGKMKRAQEAGPAPGSTAFGAAGVKPLPAGTPVASASASNGLPASNGNIVPAGGTVTVRKPGRLSPATVAKTAPTRSSLHSAVEKLESRPPVSKSGGISAGKVDCKSTPRGNGTSVPDTSGNDFNSKMDAGQRDRSPALSNKMDVGPVVTKNVTGNGGNDATMTCEPQGSVTSPVSKCISERQPASKRDRNQGDLKAGTPEKRRLQAVKSGGPTKRRRSDPVGDESGRPTVAKGVTPVSSPQFGAPVAQVVTAQGGTARLKPAVSPAKTSDKVAGNSREPNEGGARPALAGVMPGQASAIESHAISNVATGRVADTSRAVQGIPACQVADGVTDKPSVPAQVIHRANTTRAASDSHSQPVDRSSVFAPGPTPGLSHAVSAGASQNTALGVAPSAAGGAALDAAQSVAPSAVASMAPGVVPSTVPGAISSTDPGAATNMASGGGSAFPQAAGSGIASAYNPSSGGGLAGGTSAPVMLANGQLMGRGNAPNPNDGPPRGNSGPSVSVLSLDNVLSAVVQTIVLVMDQRIRPLADRLDALTNEVQRTRAGGPQSDVPVAPNGTTDTPLASNNFSNLVDVVKQQHEDHADQLSKLRREVKKLRSDHRTVVNEVVSTRDADLKQYISECTQYGIQGDAAPTAPGTFATDNVDPKVEYPLHDFGGRQPYSSWTRKDRMVALAARQVTMWLLESHHECRDPTRVAQWSSETASTCLAAAAEKLATFPSYDLAFSGLVDDLGGDNVELGWFLNPAAPEGLPEARVNYSAWDPPPNDDEWVIETQLLAEIASRFHDVLAVTDLSETTDDLATTSELVRAAAQLARSVND